MSPHGVPTGEVWLPDIAPPGDWVRQAACRDSDPDLFFPRIGASRAYRVAVAICDTCPVRQACLDYAVANRIRFGVWGGLNTERRRPLMRVTARPPRRFMPAHADPGRYRYGCRCDECRDAHRREAARYRDAAAARNAS